MSTVVIEHTSKIGLPLAKINISPRFTLRLLPCNPTKQRQYPSFLGYLKLEDHDEHRYYQTAIIALNAGRGWAIREEYKAPWVWFHVLHFYTADMIRALQAEGHQFPGLTAAGARADT